MTMAVTGLSHGLRGSSGKLHGGRDREGPQGAGVIGFCPVPGRHLNRRITKANQAARRAPTADHRQQVQPSPA